MKKVQLYFNCIFIVVVGDVFLVFFTGFAIKYKDLQEKKTEIIILNNLDTALTNLQGSSFTTSTNIELPVNINVNCDSNGYNILINEKNHINHLLASKNNLKKNLLVWYQPYEIPFKITNFYYMVDDSNINIATNNADLINSIKEEMPEEFKLKINVYPGNNLVVNGDKNMGTVLVEGKSIPYLKKEMLYAAVFSSNYSCFYDDTKKRIGDVVSIYENKARILNRGGCNYNLILSKLNLLRDFDHVNYQVIQDIETLNRNLISMNCPGLF